MVMRESILVSFVVLGLLSAAALQCCGPLMAAKAIDCMPESDTDMPMADCCLATDVALQGAMATLTLPQTVTKAAWSDGPGIVAPLSTGHRFISHRTTPRADKPPSFQTCVLLI